MDKLTMALFAPIFGRYRSESLCEGVCPTGRRVRFHEEFRLSPGDQWVTYEQKATAENGATLHTESGVFRGGANPGELEVALAMNSGRLELGAGSIVEGEVRTDSTQFFNDRLGVKAIARQFFITPEGCNKHLWLANGAWPELTHHMWGTLVRIE